MRTILSNMNELLGHLQNFEREISHLKSELENSHNVEKECLDSLKAKEIAYGKLKAENGLKFETACQEIKKLKVEMDSIKKDKNALSVAVKSAKKEIKEQAKRSELKMTDYEKKIFELMEYKKEKLAKVETSQRT